MLNELELISLILEGESQRVDFKRQLNLKTKKGKAEFVKDIVSLANSSPNGGYILVGVNDNGSVAEFNNEFKEEQLQQIARAYINPPINLNFQTVSVRFPHKTIQLSQ